MLCVCLHIELNASIFTREHEVPQGSSDYVVVLVLLINKVLYIYMMFFRYEIETKVDVIF